MADITYYVAPPFVAGHNGFEPREAVECRRANLRYEVLGRRARSEGHIGTVAFSPTGGERWIGRGGFSEGIRRNAKRFERAQFELDGPKWSPLHQSRGPFRVVPIIFENGV
jgi:hypothetical protein